MKIIEKLKAKNDDVFHHKAPTIAIFGDSMSAGCFELYTRPDNWVEPKMDPSSAYDVRLRQILVKLFPESSPVIINASRSGGRCKGEKERLERDVLSFHPDLVIVAYGLNDANGKEEEIGLFDDALCEVFDKIKATGAEVIFMTPQVRCAERSPEVTDPAVLKHIDRISAGEREGWLLKYMDVARDVCKRKNVPVCDCIRLWEEFRNQGVDVNLLMSNKINHPTREWHWQFAYELIKTMFLN